MKRPDRRALGLALALLSAAIGGGPLLANPGTGKLYGTDGKGGKLYALNPATGAATLIGTVGFPIPGLAVDPTTGVLYASRGSGTASLYRIDPRTGAPTLVGNAGIGFAGIPGLDFDAAGNLLASANIVDDGGTGGDHLAIINKNTGAATIIGPFGGGIGLNGGPGGIESVAFDANGVLYGTSADQFLTGEPPSLYRINRSTGQATLVGPIVDSVQRAVAGGVAGLQFACDGTLYGGTGGGDGNLVTINPTTGAFTSVGHSFGSFSLAGLAFQSGCGCRPIQIGGPLGWTSKAPLPIGHEGATGVIIGPRLYVTHGRTTSSLDTADNFVYDINTNTWSTRRAADVRRSELTGVCVQNATGQGLVFAVGGRSSGPLQAVEVYNPVTDTWAGLPPMPTPRRGLGAAFVPDLGVAGGSLGSVFVFGGSTGGAPHAGAPLAANEAFDVGIGTWMTRAPMPKPMMDIYSTTYFPGTRKIYVFGGFDGTSVTPTVQIYDPAADAWTLGRPMTTPRSNLVSGVCGPRIFAIGGYNGSNLTANESYDPFTDTWFTPLPSKPSPASEMGSQSIYTGAEIFAVGSGLGGAAGPLQEAFTCGARPGPCRSSSDCDDGIFCNGAEACDIPSGQCRATVPPACDDGNACTTDRCDEASRSCLSTALVDGTSCADGLFCNGEETCRAGACTAGTPIACGDGNICTDDHCDESTRACVHTPEPNGTYCADPLFCNGTETCQSGTCRPGTPLACNDGNGCTSDRCDESSRACAFTAVPNGTSCADSLFCNGSETCQAGTCTAGTTVTCNDGSVCTSDICDEAIRACRNPPVADGTSCSDGRACNGDETCRAGTCSAGTSLVCNDSKTCTTDTCDDAKGCVFSSVPDGTSCSDGLACNGDETCQAGTCRPRTPLVCNDNTVCTTDTCDDLRGCVFTPVADGTSCSDGLACNGDETCRTGACTAGTPLVCNDNTVCTSDTCDDALGCVFTPVADGISCSDGRACNGDETCRAGTCSAGTSLVCNDSNTCTTDTCDDAKGCVFSSVPDGTSCSDGRACNGDETCQAGTCRSGTPLVCNDNTVCTSDTCDDAKGCVFSSVPDGTSCSDGLACNGDETCRTGACTAGTPLVCNDNTVCTSDTCDDARGCVFTPVADGTSCSDGLACNGDETCRTGACTGGTPLVCNDNTVCTSDTCDDARGCVFTPVADGTSCSDGLACNGDETCRTGACTGGTPLVCNDNTVCTTDTCDDALGCVFTPVADGTSCSDGRACNGDETCQAGTCRPGTPLVCNDNTVCTTDTCDDLRGCVFTPVADGTSCSDGLACNGEEKCISGTCRSGVAPLCDDGIVCTVDRCDEAAGGCVHDPASDSERAAGPDGVCDTVDDNLSLFGPDGRCGTGDEGMGDGICDPVDNCPTAVNPTQDDSDRDGAGDACDPDSCPAGNIMRVPDDLSGLPGTRVSIPVILSDVTGQGVLSADFRIRYNSAVILPTGATLGPLGSGCVLTDNLTTPGEAIVAVFCNSSLTGSGPLVVIDFDVVGRFGQGTPLHFAQGILNEGTPAVCLDDGRFAIPATADIRGRILYYRDHLAGVEPSTRPVPGAIVGLTGTGPGVPDSATSDGAGGYAFAGKPLFSNYTVTPGKTDDFRGAVSSFDAALSSQAVVGLITLSPNQALAADVSGNGAVSSFDSALIAQFTVGLITRFPVATRIGSDWFMVPVPALVPNQTIAPPDPVGGVPGSISYTPLTGDAGNQDFIAGLFGDISGNYVAAATSPLSSAAAALSLQSSALATTAADTSEARLRLGSTTAVPGQTIRLALEADRNAARALGFDLELRYDASFLRLVQVETGEAASVFTLTSNRTEPGLARIGLFDAHPLTGPGELAVFTFEVLAEARGETTLQMGATLDEGRIPVVVKEARVRVRPAR